MTEYDGAGFKTQCSHPNGVLIGQHKREVAVVVGAKSADLHVAGYGGVGDEGVVALGADAADPHY